ncbi:MAG TPA: hemerythrin domain-containing protein [Flavisolibacter sp.]
MNKQLHQFFTNDHRRLEKLLTASTEMPGSVEMEHYNAFRSGLLKHIKMEEKVLFPAAQKANGGIPLPLAAKLRLDHAALTSLMVLTPGASLIKVLWHILEKHDLIEEEPGGMYDVCSSLTESQTAALLHQLSNMSEVPLHSFNDSPFAFDAARRSLARAGYDFDAIVAENE